MRYHPDTDSLYLRFSDTQVEESGEVAPETVLDFDSDGNVVGIEIYGNARARLDLSRILVQRSEAPGRHATLDLNTSFVLEPVQVRDVG